MTHAYERAVMNRSWTIAVALCLASPALADTINYNNPTFDRWNYPFNGTVGTRDVATLFSSGFVPGMFDDRDAQFLNTFVTAGDVATGLGASNYRITSARFTVTLDSRFADVLVYDNTYDAFSTARHPAQGGNTQDTDAGRPLELYGTGFRNGLNPFSYNDSQAFAFDDITLEGVRNAYAADVDANGQVRDVSNNVRDGFEANPFAIGQVAGMNPGDLIGADTTFTFDIDTSHAGIQAYLAAGLDFGAISLSLTSLHPATQPGGGGDEITFPGFYTNESFFPNAQAATLEFTYEIVPSPAAFTVLLGGGVLGMRRRRA